MLQSYKYEFLKMIRQKDMIFWSLAFPLILGSLMFFAFGGLNDPVFSGIPVGVVEENAEAPLAVSFRQLIDELAATEDPLVAPVSLTLEEAREQLHSGDILGFYQVGEEGISLFVSENGISQSVLKQVSDRFIQVSSTVGTIATYRSDLVEQTMGILFQEIDMNEPLELGRGDIDIFTYMIYTVLAMACFMGAMTGVYQVVHIQANQSPLAARRSVAPMKKIAMIVSHFFAGVTVQFLLSLVGFLYFWLALNIDFGGREAMVLLVILMGCATGISFGIFFGTLTQKWSAKTREGLVSGVSMVMYALSGMMSPLIRTFVREHLPILDQINPITVMSDAFYILSTFRGYEHFAQLMIRLLVMTAIFCVCSALLLRRKRYDSV